MKSNIDFPEEYFETDASEGVWKRFQHPTCTNGYDKSLAICRVSGGWHWHCHRCNIGSFRSAENLDPQKMMKWIKSSGEKALVTDHFIELPEDFEVGIPLKGLAWLYGNGVSDEQIKRYNFGYSRFYDRVILPVYGAGEKLVFWEGRYLGTPDKYHPKYMKVSESNRKDIYFKVEGHGLDIVILVEDILSGVCVGEVADCYAMLYAFVPDDVVFKLVKKYKKIVIWLDPDKQVDMINYIGRYRSFDLDVQLMTSTEDPKFYTAGEIREKIYGN